MARIAFFPEAAFGPALNSVGIAQACQKLGHEPVFLCDPGFVSVFEGYGFPAHGVPMSEPMAPEELAKYWVDFINGHIPNFRKSPYEQIDNYVKDCWEAIVSTAVWAEKSLPAVLAEVEARPDLHRQCDPVPGDQAPWRAVGADHLLQRERDPRPRDPAAPVGLRRARQGLLRGLRGALQRGRGAHPRPVQRVPGRVRREALPARRVLRAVALAESPALPGAGEVQAQPSARPRAVPVPGRLRARGGALRGPGVRRQRRQAPGLCQLRQPGLGRHRTAQAADRGLRASCPTGHCSMSATISASTRRRRPTCIWRAGTRSPR